VLVVDTNILLSSLPMFSSLVESMHWTVLVPLPVIMELDGLKGNSSEQLGKAAENALEYISSHIRSHSMSLKVQTSKGNYLATLNVRTEDVDFTSGNAERNMDDLILKAAIWHDEHWVDRSAMLKSDGITRNISNPSKVVLLSLDRNCKSRHFYRKTICHSPFTVVRLKARSRQLPAAGEKDLAALLSTGT
jgi:protein SMG6